MAHWPCKDQVEPTPSEALRGQVKGKEKKQFHESPDHKSQTTELTFLPQKIQPQHKGDFNFLFLQPVQQEVPVLQVSKLSFL